MYSFVAVASAAHRARLAFRAASVLSRVGSATAALTLLFSSLGLAGEFLRSLPDQAAYSAESVSQPSTGAADPVSGSRFATEFGRDTSGASAALKRLSPREVATLWNELPADFRSVLIHAEADVIGNLPGISYSDRHVANVSRLADLRQQALSDVHRALSRSSSPAADVHSELMAVQASDRLDALEILVDRFVNRSGFEGADADVPHHLIELDATVIGPPLVAVTVGDLDSAAFASFFVPGMNSSVLQLSDYLRGVERMQEASVNSAAVLWLGYESPGPVDTVSTTHAEVGSVRLAAALEGYDAVRDAAETLAEVSVIGHSYGSTTAALALSSGNFGVSSFVLIGSAGVPDDIEITDLHVRPERVYVSQASKDALADSGRFWSGRTNPAAPEWGAQFFGSDGTTLPDGTILAAVKAHDAVGASHHADHDKYLGDGTESLYDIRKIITGQCHDITPDSRFSDKDETLLADGAPTRP